VINRRAQRTQRGNTQRLGIHTEPGGRVARHSAALIDNNDD